MHYILYAWMVYPKMDEPNEAEMKIKTKTEFESKHSKNRV